MARRHHVISAGYQRRWANGQRILLIDKTTRWARPVGVRDAFVEKGFNARTGDLGEDEELEDEWARLEQAAVPHLARVANGAPIDVVADMEIKTMMALHFARSYAMRDMFETIWRPQRDEPLRGMNLDKLRRAWQKDHNGVIPTDEEIAAIIEPHLEEWHDSNVFMVEQMASAHNRMLDILRETHLQLLVAPPGAVEFIVGDEPVVRVAEFGLRLRVPVMEADGLYFPIGRRRAVTVTTIPRAPEIVSRATIQRLNRLVWRAAKSQVACHPAADWVRSTGF